MFHLPIKTRKAILEACRVQVPVYLNSYLKTLFETLQFTYRIPLEASRDILWCKPEDCSNYDEISIRDVISWVDRWTLTSPGASFLSYFARSEKFLEEGIREDLITQSFNKESEASFQGNRPSVLPYTELFDSSTRVGHTLRCALETLSRRISDSVIFPTSSTKLCGRGSTGLYHLFGGPDVDVSTESLLRFYFITGIRIQGNNEVNAAWKYNELKPRTFYALGGADYFSSNAVKNLVNQIVDCLPATNRFLRYDPTRVTEFALSEDEVLVTYDYSSFTTSLSELKYFLYHLGNQLLDTWVYILDVHQGLLRQSVGELIQTYAEETSFHSAYDVSPTIACATLYENFRQTCSGMLGVPGNIGFSMFTHGVSASSWDDETNFISVVGDDTLRKVPFARLGNFMSHTQRLVPGIAPDKFAQMFTPMSQEDSDYYAYKYLKRPLTLTDLGFIVAGELISMPNAALLFNIDAGNRDAGQGSVDSRLSSFLSSLGRFLDKLRISNQDPSTARCILDSYVYIYSKLGIPIRGSFRPQYGGRDIPVSAPPLLDAVLEKPWKEILVEEYTGEEVMFPELALETPPPVRPMAGMTFLATSSPLSDLLVTLGIAERRPLSRLRIAGPELLEEMNRNMSSEISRLYEYSMMYDPPDWYQDVHSQSFLNQIDEVAVPVESTKTVSIGSSVWNL